MNITQVCEVTKQASYEIMNASTSQKNAFLDALHSKIMDNIETIIFANKTDIAIAISVNTPQNMLDRMLLNQARIKQICIGIKQVIALPDPVGEITLSTQHQNGLVISQMRVALGVVAMIYEARPNVTIDAASLAIKSGNAIILRGSKNIINTNKAIVKLIKEVLIQQQLNPNIVNLIEDLSRDGALLLMRQHQFIDVLIPRGSAQLIKQCVDNSSIPLLETGSGNCHIYIDDEYDESMAIAITENAKTTRTSVCNSCESILIHHSVNQSTIKALIKMLLAHKVIVHADPALLYLDEKLLKAHESDYAQEYLGLEISIKIVDSLSEAINHINQYSTHHSETIVSTNIANQTRFLKEVDSACVFVNASTRFSDGFEFNLGAEIGISTQKLHARGPMGIEALTSLKYIIQGQGQVRK